MRLRLQGNTAAFHRPWPSRRVLGDDDAFFTRSAVVICPHADDETLGCGGTILLKRAAGARVLVVYTTDSAGLDGSDELRATRRVEALRACAVLGVSAVDVHFLGFPDGDLSAHVEAAAAKLRLLLGEVQPEQVFLPYGRDGHADHEASHRAGRVALSGMRPSSRPAETYEYAVWGVYHWPWYSLPLTRDFARRTIAVNTVKALFGLRVAAAFARAISVRVGPVRTQKLEALSCHETQMGPLAGVGGGEFLRVQLAEHETFRVARVEPV